MKRITMCALAAAAACGSLPDQGGGIVALEVVSPSPASLAIGRSITLHARALNLQGDSVAADLFWRTPDTTLVALDTVRGVVVALANSGVARIQARVGTLVSNIISITLQPDSTTSARARP